MAVPLHALNAEAERRSRSETRSHTFSAAAWIRLFSRAEPSAVVRSRSLMLTRSDTVTGTFAEAAPERARAARAGIRYLRIVELPVFQLHHNSAGDRPVLPQDCALRNLLRMCEISMDMKS